MRKTLLLSLGLVAAVSAPMASGQAPPALVQVEQVRSAALARNLPLSGRVHSRNDADMSMTLAGELKWVLEPGTEVAAGDVIAELDQLPIELRKLELEHLVERERINVNYLDKELQRLRQLREDNNASERMLDEGSMQRDASRMDIRSLEARIDQVNDELRRSQLVAPYAGVIAERHKEAGEYARPGDVIARVVDPTHLELRFEIPVVYQKRISRGQLVNFAAQGSQLLGDTPQSFQARIRTIIPTANANSQTFQVRADIDTADTGAVLTGQLVNLQLSMASADTSLQVPRDAIVLRGEGKFVFRIGDDDTAHKVVVTVGEGAADWVSVNGDLSPGDWVAIRGLERLRDGQTVNRQGS
ncbi:efflux RND transporter periplasmic adaptor subunit [Halioglobus maricola]|uniref:efflux RND transporter periplasmic adaptor subunit n=1 Tax=Halioglobus maricola TaxID=2601894 RepID=UPI0014795B2F|nr:efflux RND transporter periplasmic adaptor subunit [Halioglobus maricola]